MLWPVDDGHHPVGVVRLGKARVGLAQVDEIDEPAPSGYSSQRHRCVDRSTGAAESRFDIHEHYARSHHFDLRLERDGVLWSWAVPKGMPTDPSRNRLAVRVEDHELSHLGFQDPTPVRRDGENTVRVQIWDKGTYRTESFSEDKLVVKPVGQRLRSRYAIFRTDGQNWLVHLIAPHHGWPRGRSTAQTGRTSPVAVGARHCSSRAASPSTGSQPETQRRCHGVSTERGSQMRRTQSTASTAGTPAPIAITASAVPVRPTARFARHLHPPQFGSLQRRQQSLHPTGPIRGQPVVGPANPLVRPSDSLWAPRPQIHTEVRVLEGARSVKSKTPDLGPVRHHDDTRAVGPYPRVGHPECQLHSVAGESLRGCPVA
ncbi:MAG: hypothetical protein GY713_19505 [Actinomycetia bacterium]|nr:hypothetical protein [Actinomycetes bacterium]